MQAVEVEADGLVEADSRRNGEFLTVHARIHQYGAGMRQRGGEGVSQGFGGFDAKTLDAHRLGGRGEVGVDQLRAVLTMPAAFISSSTKASAPLLKTTICVLAELRNALRSGNIWVQGSRQFKAFDEYLLPAERFESQK